MCRKCGFRNLEDDAFCGSCGSFLEWTGEKQPAKVARKVVEQVEEERRAAAAAPRAGLVQRAIQAANHLIAGPQPEAEADGESADAEPAEEEVETEAEQEEDEPGEPLEDFFAAAPEPSPPAFELDYFGSDDAEPADVTREEGQADDSEAELAKLFAELTQPAEPVDTAGFAEDPPPPRLSDAAALVAPVEEFGEPEPSEPPEQPLDEPAELRAPVEIQEQAPRAARARAVPVTRTAPSRRLLPGDLVCDACGEGNPGARKFCSRCGTSLVRAAVVRERWWRRLLRRLVPRRGPKVVRLDQAAPGAGKGGGKDGAKGARLGRSRLDLRFRLRQFYRKARVVVGVLVLASGALYGVYPAFRTSVDHRERALQTRVTEWLVKPGQFYAATTTANSSLPAGPAANATDGISTTCWLAPVPAAPDAPKPTLTFTFSSRMVVKDLILTLRTDGACQPGARPSVLKLRYSDGNSRVITPQNTGEAQTIHIDHLTPVSSLTLEVDGLYPDTVGADPTAAVAEVEFFGLKI
ncbi:zinc ribbon domain-containing protein [Kitasatospora viridis]|uniref:zinc ribbon domain-containing protein n=1 Tax=Kitasatospora viridis TaxID=281105 RepID=UPI0011A86B66|nr:zinc ribbon domain-containing protein [Kitasatospora viridis]